MTPHFGAIFGTLFSRFVAKFVDKISKIVAKVSNSGRDPQFGGQQICEQFGQ